MTNPPIAIGAFDIDGTLFHHDSKPDYLDPKSLHQAKPDEIICNRVRNLIEAGLEIHFITGRSQLVHKATLDQLRWWISQKIQATNLHTKKEWTNYEDLAAWKAEILQNVEAEWFVGDHEADEKAAEKANIPFCYAHAYSKTCLMAVTHASP